jgi:DNA-binding MarR family transcriptional regulator
MTTAASEVPPVLAPAWRQRLVEELSGLVLDNHTPRAVVRVLGWMAVCEPPEQTAKSIQDELTLSAGTVSVAVRALTDSGMLERVAHSGQRRRFYRLRPEGWAIALESRFRVLLQMGQVVDRTLRVADSETDYRLVSLRDMYAWIEASIADLTAQSHQLTQGNCDLLKETDDYAKRSEQDRLVVPDRSPAS